MPLKNMGGGRLDEREKGNERQHLGEALRICEGELC